MLATYQTAIKSPCHECKTRRNPELFPDCADFCPPVNHYLILLGDKPREPVVEEDLAKKFPPQVYSQKNIKLCTQEQCTNLCDRMIAAKADRNLSSEQISKQSGIGVSLVRSIMRRGQKRTSEENYDKFIKWLRREVIDPEKE